MPSYHQDKPRRSRTTGNAGFTLVESCMVVAVVAVLVATATPSLRSFVEARRLEGAASELATDVQLARSEAVARNRPVHLRLETTANGSCYLLHTGSAADCSCAGSGPVRCRGGATPIKRVVALSVDGIGFTSRTASMSFDPLHGTCTPASTLRVRARSGGEIDHVVNVLGRVRSCSPSGTVGGYRAC